MSQRLGSAAQRLLLLRTNRKYRRKTRRLIMTGWHVIRETVCGRQSNSASHNSTVAMSKCKQLQLSGTLPRRLFFCPELFDLPGALAQLGQRLATPEREQLEQVERVPLPLGALKTVIGMEQPYHEAAVIGEFEFPENHAVLMSRRVRLATVAPVAGSNGHVPVVSTPAVKTVPPGSGGAGGERPPRFVVFDGVADPGNLGTLIRTASALGWDGAFVLKTSVDPFGHKAVRASAGAVLSLPLAWGHWDALSRCLQPWKRTCLLAEAGGTPPHLIPAPLDQDGGGIILVLGSEARGASDNARKLCQYRVGVPMAQEAESLNVATAGAILLSEFSALRRIKG